MKVFSPFGEETFDEYEEAEAAQPGSRAAEEATAFSGLQTHDITDGTTRSPVSCKLIQPACDFSKIRGTIL